MARLGLVTVLAGVVSSFHPSAFRRRWAGAACHRDIGVSISSGVSAPLAAIPVSTLPLEASYIVSPASPSNDGSIVAAAPVQALGLASSIITYVSLVGAGVDFELLSNSLTFECRNPQLPQLLVYDRPRGSLELDESYLSIRESNVPGAGLGLYAAQTIPQGTVLGNYAGVIRPAQEFYSGKCRQDCSWSQVSGNNPS